MSDLDSATRSAPFDGTDTDLFAGPDSPLVRVSSLLAALRRRRRVWIASALVGLLAASAYFVLRAPQYSASTTLILRRSTITAQDPDRAMQTDVQLAQSRGVAGRALGQLHLNETADQFASSYKVSSLTTDILQITAHAPTSVEAVQRANALASAYLEFRGQLLQRETQVEIGAAQQEENTLQAQVPGLDNQINAATLEDGAGTNPAAVSTLADLLAHRSQLDTQIATAAQRVSDLTADIAAVVHNSTVVDPAQAQTPPTKKTVAVDVAVGLLGGLVLGGGWVVFVEATSGRVRRREDVMVAMNAPVPVSVGPIESSRRRSAGLPLHSRQGRHSSQRGKRDALKAARHLREVLATTHEPTPALAVVSVASDEAAGVVAAEAVRSLLSEGNDVLVVDLSERSCLAQRFGVGPNQVSAVEQRGVDAKLWVVSRALAEGSTIDDWMQLHSLRDETEAVVVLAALDPAEGAGHVAALAGTAVAVVTTGQSTTATLRATGQMLRAAGLRLDSTVLVDADPGDESFGVRAPGVARPPAWA